MAFNEPDGLKVDAVLGQVSATLTSRLTFIECARAMQRRATPLPEAERLRTALSAVCSLALTEQVFERASGAFPIEPVRTLDALHVATAALLTDDIPGLVMVALDRRVRANCRAMLMPVLPDLPDEAP